MPEPTRHRPMLLTSGRFRNGPGTPRQIHRDNTKFLHWYNQYWVILKNNLGIDWWLGTLQCPAISKYPLNKSIAKERKIYKYMSYSVSVQHSVISYTIDVTDVKQRTLTKRWRHIEPQRNEDQQCARNYQHHPGAFWDKLGYTAAFGYTENGMTWYKIRNELLK